MQPTGALLLKTLRIDWKEDLLGPFIRVRCNLYSIILARVTEVRGTYIALAYKKQDFLCFLVDLLII